MNLLKVTRRQYNQLVISGKLSYFKINKRPRPENFLSLKISFFASLSHYFFWSEFLSAIANHSRTFTFRECFFTKHGVGLLKGFLQSRFPHFFSTYDESEEDEIFYDEF